jgi:hypothetical protein
MASAFEQIIKHVSPIGGGTEAAATNNVACSSASQCLVAFDVCSLSFSYRKVYGQPGKLALEQQW